MHHSGTRWSTLHLGDEGTNSIVGTVYPSERLRSLAKFVRCYFWTMPLHGLLGAYNDIFWYGNSDQFTSSPPVFYKKGKLPLARGSRKKPKNPRVSKIFVSAGRYSGDHDIRKVYEQRGFYWGTDLMVGTYVQIELKNSTFISRILFNSGNTWARTDTFLETSLYVSRGEGFCEKNLRLVGRFGSDLVDFTSDASEAIACVRLSLDKLRVDEKGNAKWLIISEISLIVR